MPHFYLHKMDFERSAYQYFSEISEESCHSENPSKPREAQGLLPLHLKIYLIFWLSGIRFTSLSVAVGAIGFAIKACRAASGVNVQQITP